MAFDLQPTLQGTLIKLRPLRPEDFASLYEVASDPLIWEQHPDRNRYEEKVFREFFRVALESGGALLAIDAVNDRVIGSSRYHGYNSEKSEIEVGWTFLARSHWGGIYNKEMKQLMLRHAFRFVDAVVFLIGPDNIRSQRAVEKIGGVRIEPRKNGEGRESVAYKITAQMFATTNNNNMEKNI
jgi:RimJ/RimL family protein N-acetyltransferase